MVELHMRAYKKLSTNQIHLNSTKAFYQFIRIQQKPFIKYDQVFLYLLETFFFVLKSSRKQYVF